MRSNLAFKYDDLEKIKKIYRANNDNNPFNSKRIRVEFGRRLVPIGRGLLQRYGLPVFIALAVLERQPRRKWKQFWGVGMEFFAPGYDDVAPKNVSRTNSLGLFWGQNEFGNPLPFGPLYSRYPEYVHIVGPQYSKAGPANFATTVVYKTIPPYATLFSPVPVPIEVPWNNGNSFPDPNPAARVAPDAVYAPQYDPNVARALAEPYRPLLSPRLQQPVDVQIADIEFSTISQTGLEPIRIDGRPAPSPLPQPVIVTQQPTVGRRPPRSNEKESKVRHRGTTFAVALFKTLDMVSEGGDRVDAVFQALPKDVREKWERKFRKYGPTGGALSVDKAGQYGIDNADWKLRALWHNWSKVDAVAAATNLAKNEIEDKLYGRAFRARKDATLYGRKQNGLPEILKRKRKAVRR